jgi:adenine-specific DNA-methyltransferase
MSRLSDLLGRVAQANPELARSLEAEVKTLASRREFGLNFERHIPEAIKLPGRDARRGNKVVFLKSRENPGEEIDERTWLVTRVGRKGKRRLAELIELNGLDGEPETANRDVEDLAVVADLRNPICAGLRLTEKVERAADKPWHTVINGENFHALKALKFCLRGQVDCIYIDPPYNSGARLWKYNNDYVDSEDEYRHSKWLAMMERRLVAAQSLLKPERSVLIVAVDENEVHRLGLLIEQIFPASKVQMVTVLINPAGASIIDQFSRVDEHLMFVHIGSARPMRTITDTTPGTSTLVDKKGKPKKFQWEPFQRSGGNSRRQDTKVKFFPVFIDESGPRITGCGDSLPLGVDRSEAGPPPEGCIQQWPIKQDGTEACWQLSPATFREYLDAGRVRLGRKNKKTGRWGLSFLTKGHMQAIENGELVVSGRDERGALVVSNAEDKARTQIGKTMWTRGEYSATEHGSSLLRKFLPRRKFPFPKSLYAVEDALRYYVGANRDAIVLDFFAGSGTTAHAVMRLNKQDGGRRRSICVTNNEVSDEESKALTEEGLRPGDPEWESLGICEYITKPRIKAAVLGQRPDGEPVEGEYRFPDEFPFAQGFEENAAFFELTYEDPDRIQHGLDFAAVDPLLWLRAGARGARLETPTEGFSIADTYAVLFQIDAAAAFVAAIRSADEVQVAYIVTDEEKQFQVLASQLPQRIEAVRLYESYLRTFQISAGDAE